MTKLEAILFIALIVTSIVGPLFGWAVGIRSITKDLEKSHKYIKLKHGKWFALDECANEGVYCSMCHKKVYKLQYANQALKSKFCPNCGAKMIKEEGKENDL